MSEKPITLSRIKEQLCDECFKIFKSKHVDSAEPVEVKIDEVFCKPCATNFKF